MFSGGGGGQDYVQYSTDNASEGAKRPSGGEGLPDEGAFAFLRLKLNDLVHTLGGFLGKILNKKVRRKHNYIHGYTRITGNEEQT